MKHPYLLDAGLAAVFAAALLGSQMALKGSPWELPLLVVAAVPLVFRIIFAFRRK